MHRTLVRKNKIVAGMSKKKKAKKKNTIQVIQLNDVYNFIFSNCVCNFYEYCWL